MTLLPRWILESLRVGACFALVYGGADVIAGLHGWRVPIALPLDARLPFRPECSLVYLTISPGMLWVAWLLRGDASALGKLRRVLVAEVLVAGTCFLLLPADLAPGFPQAAPAPWTGWVEACRTVGLVHNLFPSLHVAFAATTAGHAPRRWRPWLIGWALLVAASTLLLHLHHILDVAGGLLLAGVVEYGMRPWHA